jgi:hypothetical protein
MARRPLREQRRLRVESLESRLALSSVPLALVPAACPATSGITSSHVAGSSHSSASEQTSTAPNTYHLHGHGLKVTYVTADVDGTAHLTYRNGHKTLQFSGDEIQVEQSEMGTLVTVTVAMTVDRGSTSFTLVLPETNLGDAQHTRIHAEGITTLHKFTNIPAFQQGQQDFYHISQLEGTAAHAATTNPGGNASAAAAETDSNAAAPNEYHLHGGGLDVDYIVAGDDSQSHFTYQQGQHTLKFSGDDIRTQQTSLGTLVTVTIAMSVDTGSTTFTLFIPRVNLIQSNQAPVKTIGITTVHKFSTIPMFQLGQRELYHVTHLQGPATGTSGGGA